MNKAARIYKRWLNPVPVAGGTAERTYHSPGVGSRSSLSLSHLSVSAESLHTRTSRARDAERPEAVPLLIVMAISRFVCALVVSPPLQILCRPIRPASASGRIAS